MEIQLESIAIYSYGGGFLCSSENTDGQPNSQSKDMGQRLSLSFQFIIPATLR